MKNNSYSVVKLTLAIVLFVIGVCIFAYPIINEWLISTSQEQQIENFRNIKANISAGEKTSQESNSSTSNSTSSSTDNNASNSTSNSTSDSMKYAGKELLKAMSQYNNEIYTDKQTGLQDVWSYEQPEFDLFAYGLSNDAVAELRIPAMDVDLPVYLGASNTNMARGAAQLGETSMPIGGNNTNCVIAGHRGASGGKFFLDIENINIGDYVFLDNFWETLTYKVVSIEVIDPYDIDKIKIQDGKDMLTLITCHPYPTNYKRYVVYCERTDDVVDFETQKNTSNNATSFETQKDTSNNTTNFETQKNTSDNVVDNKTDDIVDGNNEITSSKLVIALDRCTLFIVPILIISLSIVLFLSRRKR